jgi:hypothetical protein
VSRSNDFSLMQHNRADWNIVMIQSVARLLKCGLHGNFMYVVN